jgi:hypothetical protein
MGTTNLDDLNADTISGDIQADAGSIGTAEVADAAITAAKVASSDGNLVCSKVALTAGAADAFALAWQNPEATAILVDRVIVDITTAGGTATAVLDVAVVANATSTGDTILDGVDLNATGLSDSLNGTDNGTNGGGKVVQVDEADGTNDYITGKILVEAASSLVGNAYIYYRTV